MKPFPVQWILLPAALVFSQGAALPTLSTGEADLSFGNPGGAGDAVSGAFGVHLRLHSANAAYSQELPLAAEVVNGNGQADWVTAAYDSLQVMGTGAIRCSGTLASGNGSVFSFIDTYGLDGSKSAFMVDREVRVESARAGDKGFSTRMAFEGATAAPMGSFGFFAPSIWYMDNADVSGNALATDYSDTQYWFREDRMPLPLFMLRRKDDGATFSVYHADANGSTFTGEDGLARIIDSRMEFASLGMRNDPRPSVGMLYPGSEGERTLIYGGSPARRWSLRSHPVTQGFRQHYRMAFRLTSEPDYPTALKKTWSAYYAMAAPPRYACDLNAVYAQQISILDAYWKSINGSAGVPFRIRLNGEIENESDYNFNLGFVGQQPGNAALLIRDGILSGREDVLAKGERMADFWAGNGIGPNGAPRVWYDPYPKTWRGGNAFLRQVGDGMRGLLLAWSLEKKRKVDKPAWLAACIKAGDWAGRIQNPDGSFPRGYDGLTGAVTLTEKTNTSHIIPFLVELHIATGDPAYKAMALKAGAFIHADIHRDYRYVGGAIDNPNVPDKESASMALRAFLALYDSDNDPEWLRSALQAAYYYETWVYAWNVPVPADDTGARFPHRRSTTGLSVIATGGSGSDTYAAIDAFDFYRLYLYSGDPHLADVAALLLYNTKQYVNWDPVRDPIPGFATGFLGEALNVTVPRGHGVGYYLPWQTYNMLEPFIHLRDAFGAEDYDLVRLQERIGTAALKDRNLAFSRDRGIARVNPDPIRPIPPGFHPVGSRQAGTDIRVLRLSASRLLIQSGAVKVTGVELFEAGGRRIHRVSGPFAGSVSVDLAGQGSGPWMIRLTGPGFPDIRRWIPPYR
ncbi:MAG: hypothetical protein JWP91_3564 [Fibrobacteres bacterium]|nr:hypothetical protein [Fibrobacterota bacterium]